MAKIMTEERKKELTEWADGRSAEELSSSLGFAIHFEMWERACIIRDSATRRNLVIEAIPWDTYITDKIKKVLYD